MVNSLPICVKPSFWLNQTCLRHFHEKSILKHKYFDLWPNNDRIELKYVSFMRQQLQENWSITFVYLWKFLKKIKILQLFFVKWYFLFTWMDTTIFLFEWMTETKLLIYFSLPSFEHILVLYTPHRSEIFYFKSVFCTS